MKFKLSSELEYTLTQPVTFLLSVRARLSATQRILSEEFTINAPVEHVMVRCAATGTRFDRVHAANAGNITIRYQAEVEVLSERLNAGEVVETGPETFDLDVLPYLYPSRYCQSDRIGRLSYDLVSHLKTQEEQVRAIVEWIGTRVSYVSGSTNANTSATDTLVERAGVCRDYAHLGIALCRSMNIPARYFTGYAHDLNPPDFHACFETWIGGRWLFWDATGLASPDGVVRIGTGRDASDCSVCTSFGPLQLQRQEVHCQVLDLGYRKRTPEELLKETYCLDGAGPASA
ncbi:MAG: Transglutaminase-like superfamily protein [Verrucomicrobiales bacterium]|nr:Transglutaminase-like superfamily protein [Verrucomicrobiales bacterium]